MSDLKTWHDVRAFTVCALVTWFAFGALAAYIVWWP